MSQMNDEIQKALDNFMHEPGSESYILINPDGIPFHFKGVERKQAVQYAALISDLVAKIKLKLGSLFKSGGDGDFHCLRMRTKDKKELIVTSVMDFIMIGIQNCDFHKKKEEKKEGDKEEGEEKA